MYVAMTVPEDVLARLRAGAKRAVLDPIMDPANPWCSEARARFKRALELADVIGWEPGQAAEEAMLDIADHRLALYEALVLALRSVLGEIRSADVLACESVRGSVARLSAFALLLHSGSRICGGHGRRLQRLQSEAGEILADIEDEAEQPGSPKRSCDQAFADALAREREDDRSHASQRGDSAAARSCCALAIDEAELERCRCGPRVRNLHADANLLMAELQRERADCA